VGLPADVIHDLVEGVEVAANPVLPDVGVRLGGEPGWGGRLEILVDELEQRLDPALIEGREPALDDLDVLARHPGQA
jgi:hypothetical protein